jgi:hypothetical protein
VVLGALLRGLYASVCLAKARLPTFTPRRGNNSLAGLAVVLCTRCSHRSGILAGRTQDRLTTPLAGGRDGVWAVTAGTLGLHGIDYGIPLVVHIGGGFVVGRSSDPLFTMALFQRPVGTVLLEPVVAGKPSSFTNIEVRCCLSHMAFLQVSRVRTGDFGQDGLLALIRSGFGHISTLLWSEGFVKKTRPQDLSQSSCVSSGTPISQNPQVLSVPSQ